MLIKLKNGEYDKSDEKKTNSAIEVYKSLALREELLQYLKEDHIYNNEALNKIDKRWNKVSKEEE